MESEKPIHKYQSFIFFPRRRCQTHSQQIMTVGKQNMNIQNLKEIMIHVDLQIERFNHSINMYNRNHHNRKEI